MEIGDIVIVIDSMSTSRASVEQPAIVTYVHSETEVDCAIVMMGQFPELIPEFNLHHQSVRARGAKRFRLKGEATL